MISMSEPAKSPTILVIDDDAEIRYSLSRVLSSLGYQISEAPSGEQGIALVKWTMFNQNGEEVYTFTPIAIVPRRA